MDAGATPAVEDVGNDGERMVVANFWPYWAHLSIYHFALPFAAGRRVLDAGAGEGYGAAYLARHGAQSVRALEFSPEAVRHARRCYAGLAVGYEEADLNQPLQVADRSVDLFFSSNVFEHVGRVDALAAEAARVLAADGVAVIAVPPITSAASMEADMGNPFHVHHIPPSAWEAKLRRFFADVRCHGHRGRGEFASKEREQQEIALSPDRVTIRETDFEFPATTGAALDRDVEAITAVFVCRAPHALPGPETIAERTPADWCEGAVAARLVAEGRRSAKALQARLDEAAAMSRQDQAALAATATRAAAAEAQAAALAARVAAVEASTSWRLTAPLRRIVTAIRPR